MKWFQHNATAVYKLKMKGKRWIIVYLLKIKENDSVNKEDVAFETHKAYGEFNDG